ncbi:MFS transporter [Pseudomonas sp. Teo4]|uniref:MFS transporter n=1 Tax=Pseudomonas sp. Teo4 TaxID=3064528 RepID=UPI002AB98DB7|nr:MFS transporter [Pseudomonas sp. Teo4]MDZ3992412.1 Fosfomycin resistance protein AbaF [Pseudomonas sp. Teo4]
MKSITAENAVDAAPSNLDPAQTRKIVMAAYVGTALEWYDFFLFGTVAAIVFAPLFFPAEVSSLSVLGAFLSFGVGFAARPLGAMIFGHIGDRYGRRAALVITVMMMGIATTLIGALPTYASAGIVAPILLTLLRAVQGVAAGGEWGGATLLAIEYAPPRQRSLYASIVQLGSPTGTLLSSGAVALAASLPGDAFLEWAWRVPFLVSIVLVGVALWLRWKVEETPAFRQLANENRTEAMPVLEVFRQVPGRLVLGIASFLYCNAGFFLITAFMISYVTKTLGMPNKVILQALTLGALMQMVTLLFAGRLADRIGSGKTVVIGYLVTLVLAFPTFWLVDTREPLLICMAMVLGLGLATIPYAPIGTLLNGLFPEHLRYTGLGLSANFSGMIAGFMPALATWFLMLSDGKSWGPALLLAMIAFISLVGACIAMRITRNTSH